MRRLLPLATFIAALLFVLTAGTGRAGAAVLLGNDSVASLQDHDAAGIAEAFSFTAGTSGRAQSISVYVDRGSSVSGLVVGLYTDNGGQPGSLLASGSGSGPTAGEWNDVGLDSTPTLSSATTYWLALLGTGGQLTFRDTDPGAGTCAETSAQSNLTSLPSNWTTGATWTSCSLSADVNGTPSSATTSAPTNTALPAISGTAEQGQTLTTSNGVWSNSPTSYTYRWEDCDTSGSNCESIRGATASTYSLAASDVGSTLRSVVTATNAVGSTSATSIATAPASGLLAPAASFAYSPASPVTGQSVHFDGTGSTCAVSPCSYSWADDPPSGGSWPLGSGQSIDFTFVQAATKYVTLTVTDGLDRTATVEHDVIVASAAVPVPPSAPSNSVLPSISGTAEQGQKLTTSNGSWSNSPTSYAYQWQDCNASGTGCANIAGATSNSYTLQASDVDDTVRAVVHGVQLHRFGLGHIRGQRDDHRVRWRWRWRRRRRRRWWWQQLHVHTACDHQHLRLGVFQRRSGRGAVPGPGELRFLQRKQQVLDGGDHPGRVGWGDRPDRQRHRRRQRQRDVQRR